MREKNGANWSNAMKFRYAFLSKKVLAAGVALSALVAVTPSRACANDITVDSLGNNPFGSACYLGAAIQNHNCNRNCTGVCGTPDKNGTDTIWVDWPDGVYEVNFAGLEKIYDTLTIRSGKPGKPGSCVQLTGDSALTIGNNAKVTLIGIGSEPNPSSDPVINNEGGQLTIQPDVNGNPCTFSNHKRRPLFGGRSPKGGIIWNHRENQRTGIGQVFLEGAKLVDSEADQGGAIFNDKYSTLNIPDGPLNSITENTANDGGAIYNESQGTLLINSGHFTISSNNATNGGAIDNHGGKLSITRDSTTSTANLTSDIANGSGLSRNHATFGGAIISYGGTFIISRLLLTLNSADNEGGAIYLRGVPGASIGETYIAGNTAGIDGGAIYNIADSNLKVSQSTFDSDSATQRGGGIFNSSTLEVINSTFFGGSKQEGIFVTSGSAVVEDSTIVSGLIGGFDSSPPPLSLSNSILSDVTCQFVRDAGFNLQSGTSGCPTTIEMADPLLDSNHLQDNHGPTPTIRVLTDSPAIDAIPYGNCIDQDRNHVSTDQRGFLRPDSGDGTNGPCDIGAYESDY
jgi:hypothetical protein